jgi:hypothetical protein
MAKELQAGSVAVQILGNDKQFQATLKNIENSVNGTLAKFRNALITISSLRTVFSGFSAPLQVFANFEYSISKVQAITQATTEQIKQLREQAKELGKTTFFTASQVADAQNFLGMAGFQPDQILAATPQMLDLALAGGMDLGMAADIATNISTPFKIAAKDIGLVNDILAKAANTAAIPSAASLSYLVKNCSFLFY